jgi:microcystin-dependent protein
MSDITSSISLILSIILCLVVAVIFNKVFISKTECPEQCPAGPAGPRGIKGDQGEVGPEGPRGLKGDQGDKGDAGPRGLKGDKGEQGIQGEQGPQGIAGQKGEQGPQGLLGPVGIQGAPGKDGSIVLSDSGGNPLGNYYDKNSVDNLLKPLATQASVDTAYVRKTEVYDKTTSDNRFALKTALPDLSPYALKTALPDLTPYARTADMNTKLDLKANLANPVFTGTVGGITKAMVGLGNVDNTSDLLKPVSTATTTALGLKANLESPVFTGTVGGITKAMIGLGNVDNTTDLLKPVSTATTTALGLKANLANPVFTGTVGGITKAMVGLGNVDDTSDINKPLSTVATTKFKDAYDLSVGINNKSREFALISDMNTKLDLKANLANPVFTGTVGGITKAMVGLGNVDNTSDLLKPVSTATQKALDTTGATVFAINNNVNSINTRLADYYTKTNINSMLNDTVPVGTIIAYSAATAPIGFVVCNGAEYDRIGAFAKLFAVIGTTYGTPSVATKFKVPDIKSRTLVGVDSTKALASTGGAETVNVNSTGTLTVANMPVHKHTVTLSQDGIHSNVTAVSSSGTYRAADGNSYTGYGTPGNVSTGVNATVASAPSHTHTATVGDAGSGTAFSAAANGVSVMQPYITLNYIIKYDDPSNITVVAPAVVTSAVKENYSFFGVF